MDYEKLYKDALERAKIHINIKGIGDTVDLCKQLFPELAESDDERIRKEINTLYSEIDTCISELIKARTDKDSEAEGKALFKMEGLMVATIQDLSCIEDYLEKQKEQKHPNGCFTCDEYKKGYEEGRRNGFTAGYNKAMKEVEQKEQKPSSKFHPGDWLVYDGPLGHAILQVEDVVGGRYSFVDNVSTLLVEDSDKFLRPLTTKDVEKPAELSDEDKAFLKVAIATCNRYSHKDIADWLKSLPERLNLQPKEEWSEEDEETIGTLINYFEGDALDYSADEMIRRIKALRPSWKPSKEQMEVLLSTQDMVRASGYRQNAKVLASLYEQLKRLK